MPEFVAAWPTSLDTIPRIVPGVTKTGDAGKVHSAILNGHSDILEDLEAWAGVSGSPALGSAEYRIRAAGQLVFNVQLGIPGAIDPVLPTNSAADNTTALQGLLDFVAAFGGKVTLYFPAGTYLLNEVTVSSSSTIIKGQAIDSTVLEYHGGTAAHSAWSFHGTADNTSSGRLYWCGMEDLTLDNHGNGNSTALDQFATTHFEARNVRFLAFRGKTIKGGNHADSFYVQCHFDYCGSNDGSMRAVIDFGTNGSTAWAVDAIAFVTCRWEQCGERIVNCVSNTGANLFVNKIKFVAGCKFENSNEDTNGMFAGFGTGSMPFVFSNCGGIMFSDFEITLQTLYNGVYTTAMQAMFLLTGSNGFLMTNGYISLGSRGANKKVFTSYFDVDGGTCLFWTNLVLTSGNDGCYPTSVWKWSNTPTKVQRHCCGWAFAPGTEPTADVGTAPSAPEWA